MKGKEIMIVSIIIIILLIIIIVGRVSKNKDEVVPGNIENINEIISDIAGGNKEKLGEYEKETIDGTKVNTSNKLSETKTLDGLEISNIKLVENGNLSKLTADVKNPTSGTLGDYEVKITLIDKERKELVTIAGYIDKVEAGDTVELNTSVTVDVANAYDFKISK